jgi:RNA polymerase sigma-70 factor (ECF subfamily)
VRRWFVTRKTRNFESLLRRPGITGTRGALEPVVASLSVVAVRTVSSDGQYEDSLIAALRSGDQSAFTLVVDTYHARMLRVALAYISDGAVAEEIVQETWVRVLRSIDRFEARSTLKTWIFRILVNTALSWVTRERRSTPFSCLAVEDADSQPAVEPERFRPADALWPGHWNSFPASWSTTPETRLLSGETLAHIRAAIEDLPAGQKAVITLRDIEGWSADEVCNVLQISESNQRVLLHRGRSRVRRALERYFTGI